MRLRNSLMIGFLIALTMFLHIMLESTVFRPGQVEADTSKFSKPPKQDRIHLAMLQDFEMTRDPKLNEVPVDRLLQVRQSIYKYSNTSSKSMSTEIQWEERGPINVGGRTRAILIDKNDASGNTVFAGSVSGGLWKTSQINSSNPQWQELNNQLDNLTISVIAQDPNNLQTIYIGTGEGYFNGTGMKGMGIWKSTNGGNSWSHLTSTNNSAFRYIQKIAIDNFGNLYVCTYHAGVQKSTNGGNNWQKILGQGKYASSNRAADIELASDGNLYAAMGLHTGDGMYKSTNQGISWVKLAGGLPTSGYHRIEITSAPSDPNRLYALYHDSNSHECKGIYKTTNAGTTWVPVNNPTAFGMSNFARNQAWYNLEIAVDPANPDRILLGGIDLLLSTNAGASWTQLTQWTGGGGYPYMHADQHVIKFNPNNSDKIIIGNDGGVWYSSNGTTSSPDFSSRNIGYNVTQFYSCDARPESGSNYFLAGAQDNGNQKFTSSGANNTEDVSGGDGGIVHIDQLNPDVQIVALIYNNYMISLNGGNTFYYRNFNSQGRFINPSDYDDVLKKLYAADQSGKYLRWNDPSTGGGNAQTVSVNGMNDVISSVKVSPNISGRIYLGTGNGDLYIVDQANYGSSRTGVKIRQGTGGYLSSIDVETGNEDHIIVTYSNYGVTSIYETDNGGANWQAVEGNLPDMPVRSVVFNPNDSRQALIGTEAGVWSTELLNNNNTIWSPMNNSLSLVRTDMLKFRSSDLLLLAATHGRGLYSTEYFDQLNISTDELAYQFSEKKESTINSSCPRDYRDYLIPLNINKAPNSTVAVNISSSGGTAANGTDFQIQTPFVNFSSGSSASKNIILRVFDDSSEEQEETIHLFLNSSSASIESSQITVTIIDDDKDPMTGGSSQEFQIGSAQQSISQYPLRGFYEDQRTQIIFHASELIAQGLTAGEINSLSFQILDKKSTQRFNNFKVSMKHTGLVNTSQIGDNFENGLSTVYQGNLMTREGWNKINFNQTFSWNGSDNIIVQFCFDNNFWSLDDAVATTETLFNSVQYRYADSQVGCQLSSIQNISKFRPNIRFYVENQMLASNTIYQKSSAVQAQNKNHYYDSNHKAIASIEMLNGQAVNCATLSIESIGAGLNFPAWLSGEAVSQKSYFIDIQSSGMYEVTLYFNESELVGWPDLDNLSIVKTTSSVPTSNQYSDIYFGEDLTHIELANNVHAFRFITSGDGGFALSSYNSQTVPVELLSFSVEARDNFNKLRWHVTNEIGIYGYQIERSFDGRHFEELATVKSVESGENIKFYDFKDTDLWLGNRYYFYRLKVGEANGISRYSGIESVFVKGTPEVKLIAYPNPFSEEIRIAVDVPEDDKVQRIQVQNLEGRTVLIVEPSDVKPEYKLNMENNPPGMYILNVLTQKTKLVTKKISLVK